MFLQSSLHCTLSIPKRVSTAVQQNHTMVILNLWCSSSLTHPPQQREGVCTITFPLSLTEAFFPQVVEASARPLEKSAAALENNMKEIDTSFFSSSNVMFVASLRALNQVSKAGWLTIVNFPSYVIKYLWLK